MPRRITHIASAYNEHTEHRACHTQHTRDTTPLHIWLRAGALSSGCALTRRGAARRGGSSHHDQHPPAGSRSSTSSSSCCWRTVRFSSAEAHTRV